MKKTFGEYYCGMTCDHLDVYNTDHEFFCILYSDGVNADTQLKHDHTANQIRRCDQCVKEGDK